jgi:hypothetical protein
VNGEPAAIEFNISKTLGTDSYEIRVLDTDIVLARGTGEPNRTAVNLTIVFE